MLFSKTIVFAQILALVSGSTLTVATRDSNFKVVNKLAEAPDRRREDGVVNSGLFGEPHGSAFDDAEYVKGNHARFSGVRFAGCGSGEHLGSIQSKFVAVSPNYVGLTNNVVHGQGTHIRTPVDFTLDTNDFFVSVDLTTYRAKTGWFYRTKRTRIGSITLTTNKGKTVTCGDKNASDPPKHWQFPDMALLYFSGSTGDAVDALEGHFIPVKDYFY